LFSPRALVRQEVPEPDRVDTEVLRSSPPVLVGRDTGARGPLLALLGAIAIAALGFLPIANWIHGGHQAEFYAISTAEWLSGSAIAIGGGLVFAILARRLPGLWREGAMTQLGDRAFAHPRLFGLGVAAAAFIAYLWVAFAILSARPLLIDELVQVIQARIYLSGHLSLPAPVYPEFTSVLHMVQTNGQWFSQFPPGGPAMLALGGLVGATWLVGPLCGAISVFAFWSFVRIAEPRRAVALGALLLFAFAPFMAFMAGSHMNHVPTLMWTTIAIALVARLIADVRPRPDLAFWSGIALGVAATVRPVDAFAFALPTGFWYVIRAFRQPSRWRELVASGVGVAVPLAAMLWVNDRTTGQPLLFGYQVLWGTSHDLGFHRAPWGFVHSPARGLELINLYFLRLQTYLFESPLPSLTPAVVSLALTERFDRMDRYVGACSALLVALYFAYWHDGFFLGPRFMYLLLPFLAIWTARLPALVRLRTGRLLATRAVLSSLLIAGVMAVVLNIPIRARQYRNGVYPVRLDFAGPARRAGISNSLILVRESWGSQVIARLWALGVPHSETEMLYRGVDTCALEEALAGLERRAIRDTAALRMLKPLLADSAWVVKSTYSPDPSERMLPGRSYSAVCRSRLEDDQAGSMLLTPLFTVDRGSNVYVRDLHARDSLLLRAYGNRPVYLMRPTTNEVGAPLVLIRLPEDSLRRAWSASP
jgi:hypothetical protein